MPTQYCANQNLNFARVGGFHRQEEPIGVIKLDASSREAGALKGAAIVKLLQALNNAAYGSLRLVQTKTNQPCHVTGLINNQQFQKPAWMAG